MNDPVETAASQPESLAEITNHNRRGFHPRFFVAVCVLVAGFSVPLFQVMRFALEGELYSYILLVPVVSLYLASQSRAQLKLAGPVAPATWTALLLLAGTAALIGYLVSLTGSAKPALQDQLAYAMLAFVFLLTALCAWFLSRSAFSSLIFPLGFLVFLAPLPIAAEQGFEAFLQHASAIVAHGIFEVAGTPVFRETTFFRLPGFSLEVAPECSGIHSTVALFITSVVAGRLLLHSRWKRLILTLVVLPIALLRNGLRIFVIGELCVRVGPHMIDSFIHRHGGPVFFALSLIPFSAIIYFLLRSERPKSLSPAA